MKAKIACKSLSKSFYTVYYAKIKYLQNEIFFIKSVLPYMILHVFSRRSKVRILMGAPLAK